ncbi:MAG: carboxypeptidase-like regulatory domain-containing protein [Ilumatobacteraceae bacterium]
MRATLLAPSVRIHPGIPATLDIEVTNTENVIDGISAEVYGFDPAWVPLVQPVVTLFPDTSGTLTIRFELPTSCAAGESMITVHVFSTIDAERFTDHAVLLHVEPVEAATIELRPSVVEGGSTADFTAAITNTGNIATEFKLTAIEPTRALECTVSSPTVVVPVGHTAEVVLTARGRRPLIGQMVSHNIELSATSPELELKSTARFAQKPRIPRGVITAFILLAIVALWALIFLLVVQYMRSKDAATKAVPKTWVHGTREMRVVDVASSISGRVVAATTGEGLAGITVEAMRLQGDKFETAASAATGDDGTYSLAALLPGKYKVKFSAEGFDPIWYKGTTDQTAEVLPVAPVTPVPGIDAVLTGQLGTIQGQVAAAQGAGAPAAKVTIKLIPTRDGQPPQNDQQPAVDAAGMFTAGSLQTPATYEVRIEREGFDPVVTRIELKGGPPLQLDTANLTAANGSISGQVVDGAGAGLGNVKVVVRSGNIERSILTPTTGNAGSFTLDGLPSPRTYVITFTLAGYSSETMALEVAGGEKKQLPRQIQLLGGAGTVVGVARDANGTPLGGVKVVAAKGAITAETATLTAGSGPTGAGSYAVSGLPIPGPYTVTFSLDGYQSETRLVGLPAATDVPPSVDVVLSRSTSTVSGSITVTGSSTPNRNVGLTVELSDGETQRTTVTTSTPAGGYGFSDVADGSYTLSIVDTAAPTRTVLKVVRIVVDNGGPNTHNISTAAS